MIVYATIGAGIVMLLLSFTANVRYRDEDVGTWGFVAAMLMFSTLPVPYWLWWSRGLLICVAMFIAWLWWNSGGGDKTKKKARQLGDKSRRLIARLVRQVQEA